MVIQLTYTKTLLRPAEDKSLALVGEGIPVESNNDGVWVGLDLTGEVSTAVASAHTSLNELNRVAAFNFTVIAGHGCRSLYLKKL